MIWQDVVMMIGQFVFFVAMIPTVKAVEKPAFSTSLVTSAVITLYIPTLWTLHLYVSVVSTILLAFAWWTVTYQSWKRSQLAANS